MNSNINNNSKLGKANNKKLVNPTLLSLPHGKPIDYTPWADDNLAKGKIFFVNPNKKRIGK